MEIKHEWRGCECLTIFFCVLNEIKKKTTATEKQMIKTHVMSWCVSSHLN